MTFHLHVRIHSCALAQAGMHLHTREHKHTERKWTELAEVGHKGQI